MPLKKTKRGGFVIKVGAEVLFIEFGDAKLFESVFCVFAPFTVKKKARYLIKVKASGFSPVPTDPGHLSFSVNKDSVYTVVASEFNASFDFKKKMGAVILSASWNMEIVVSALTNIFLFILLKNNSLVFHAAAVLKEGKAYIFAGPSGAGKSTAAQASKGKAILSEEIIGIYKEGKKYKAFALPYSGDARFPIRETRLCPIGGLLKLIKDKKSFIRKIPKPQALVDFLIFPPGIGKLVDFQEYFKTYNDFIEAMLCAELHFLPDGSFWRCIDGTSK
jgi:hypothetical protein